MPSSEALGRLLAVVARAVVSAAVALAIGEAALRVAGIKFEASLYNNDPATGWTLRPNSHGWTVSERAIYTRINSAGMHDREHTVAKPPDVLRIAVLGDSMTAAIQVAAADTSCAAMERAFAQCAAVRPRRVEVLNFGMPGYNLTQMLLLLRSRVWQYSPDVVLLELFSGNNVMNNRRDLNNADDELTPYYRLRGGRLELDDSFRSLPSMQPEQIRRHNQMADLMNAVRIVQLARYAYSRRNAWQHRKVEERAQKYGSDYQLRLVYKPPDQPEVEDAWAVGEAVTLAMRDEVRSRGAQFWIATSAMPWKNQRRPEQLALYGRYGTERLLYPDWRFSSLARRAGIPVVVLSDYLEEYSQRTGQALNGWPEGSLGSGHWNETGQRVVGEYLAREFCPLLGQ